MKDLCPELRDAPFNCILLPGAHNSGCYKIDWKIKPMLNANHPHKFLVSAASKTRLTRKFVQDWFLSQSLDITAQLMLGIRYLDCKITFSQNNFYISNTFLCTRLDTFIDEVKVFCCKYPSEIIILNLRYDYASHHTMTTTRDLQCLEMVKQQLGQLLIPRMGAFLSLNDLLPFGNIILFYQTFYNTLDFVWDPVMINTFESEKLLTLYEDTCTLDTKTLGLDFLSRLVPGVKSSSRKVQVQAVQRQMPNTRVSIYSMDFPTAQQVSDLICLQR